MDVEEFQDIDQLIDWKFCSELSEKLVEVERSREEESLKENFLEGLEIKSANMTSTELHSADEDEVVGTPHKRTMPNKRSVILSDSEGSEEHKVTTDIQPTSNRDGLTDLDSVVLLKSSGVLIDDVIDQIADNISESTDSDFSIVKFGSDIEDDKCPTHIIANAEQEFCTDSDEDSKSAWVQCDQVGCGKWRKLDVDDLSSVADGRWVCSMNEDSKRNACDCSQEPLPDSNEDTAYTSFKPGTLVLGKMAGYPWWPGIIEDDPDYKNFFHTDEKNNAVVISYHVTFFGKDVSRAWLNELSVRVFKGTEDLKELTTSTSPGRSNSRGLSVTLVEARKALDMTLEKRVQRYGFLRRYKGKDVPEKLKEKSQLTQNKKKKSDRKRCDNPLQKSEERDHLSMKQTNQKEAKKHKKSEALNVTDHTVKGKQTARKYLNENLKQKNNCKVFKGGNKDKVSSSKTEIPDSSQHSKKKKSKIEKKERKRMEKMTGNPDKLNHSAELLVDKALSEIWAVSNVSGSVFNPDISREDIQENGAEEQNSLQNAKADAEKANIFSSNNEINQPLVLDEKPSAETIKLIPPVQMGDPLTEDEKHTERMFEKYITPERMQSLLATDAVSEAIRLQKKNAKEDKKKEKRQEKAAHKLKAKKEKQEQRLNGIQDTSNSIKEKKSKRKVESDNTKTIDQVEKENVQIKQKKAGKKTKDIPKLVKQSITELSVDQILNEEKQQLEQPPLPKLKKPAFEAPKKKKKSSFTAPTKNKVNGGKRPHGSVFEELEICTEEPPAKKIKHSRKEESEDINVDALMGDRQEIKTNEENILQDSPEF